MLSMRCGSVSTGSMTLVLQGWRYLNRKSFDTAFLPVSETCKNIKIEKQKIKTWIGNLIQFWLTVHNTSYQYGILVHASGVDAMPAHTVT